MSKTLTYEQMMALFAKGEKETAELRKSIAEGRKETAELRKSMAEGFAESRKEAAKLSASIARLEAITEKTNARLDEAIVRLDENTARLEKTNARVDATNARLDEATADLRKNTAQLDKNTAQMKINSHNVGVLSNKLGRIIESIVIPGIVDKFNEKGFKFKHVSTRVDILNEEEDAKLAELDALLENGKFVIAVESKTDMDMSDVKEHAERLCVLRELPRFKGKKIYGALTTAIIRKGPVNYALEQGFYVLQQPDAMRVKILDFPKGHSAKAW